MAVIESHFWALFGVATALKVLLIPAYHSTDFEVHRNWLALTYSLPVSRWYVDDTSQWTLDYPPFFAYFEWGLAQVARYVDAEMLAVQNHNYASTRTKYFQRGTVIATDVVYALGAYLCLHALKLPKLKQQRFAGAVLLLFNVGLLFVDHIHFQYNGLLFGLLLLSIGCVLTERYLFAAFAFAVLLNMKHIFLYMAPAFAVVLLKFYCFKYKRLGNLIKLAVIGLVPFIISFGPFWNQLPQVFARLFPFKRGLTHAYWAPNFWAMYTGADVFLSTLLNVPYNESASPTLGLVQDYQHAVLPTVSPLTTFLLTAIFMLPILVKLMFYTSKSQNKKTFLRAVVLCACASYMFGWHVHEKAILMCLIPLSLLALIDRTDAKYAYWLSAVGYFSLLPLLFHVDMLAVRYSLYLAYMSVMYGQIVRMHKSAMDFSKLEHGYIYGLASLPLYEHIVSPLFGLSARLPFMPLMLTSMYCSVGVVYFFVRYYLFTMEVQQLLAKLRAKPKIMSKARSKFKRK